MPKVYILDTPHYYDARTDTHFRPDPQNESQGVADVSDEVAAFYEGRARFAIAAGEKTKRGAAAKSDTATRPADPAVIAVEGEG